MTIIRAVRASGNGGGGGSSPGVIWDPGNLGSYANIAALFPNRNNNLSETILQSSVTRPGGSSKAVQTSFTQDEDGIELIIEFSPTTTLYFRKYIRFSDNCSTNWPVGWKTSRVFSNGTGSGAEGDANAYMSEKFIWQGYPPPIGDADPDWPYVWGLNHACYNDDRVTQYPSDLLFGDGNPYIRAGTHWYLFETFMQINSGNNVTDGKLHCRIDKQPVCTHNDVAYIASSRGVPNGTAWTSMWFGGNYSGNGDFPSGQELFRWEDGYYVSSTADWVP